MDADSDFTEDMTVHCGRAGCACLHVTCDRGWVYVAPRRVPVKVTESEAPRQAEYERVKPCPGCKPETYHAGLSAVSRADFQRRARRVKADPRA